jgi:hypothetical protein
MGLTNIIHGWWNRLKEVTFGNKDYVQEQANIRRIICGGCHINKGGLCHADNQGKHIYTGEWANGCNCPISAKSLDPDSDCPVGKWGHMLDEHGWYLAKTISLYPRLYVNFPELNRKNVALYNNKDSNLFCSEDGVFQIPYLHLVRLVKANLVNTCKVLEGKMLLQYNRVTESLSLSEAGMKYIESLKTVPNQKLVLWVPTNFCGSMTKFNISKALSFIAGDIFRITNKEVGFLMTDTEAPEGFLSGTALYYYYWHGSEVSENVIDEVNNQLAELNK